MKHNDTDNKEIREAAALKYDAETDNAPYVVALGKGSVAEQIIDKARESDVQIVKDKKLSQVLSHISVGDEIPEELYAVVAEILVFISSMDQDYESRFGL